MKLLAELRAERHISQHDLADVLNVTTSAVGMWETGKRTPSLRMALAIARYFGVPVESISFSNHTSGEGD